MLLDLHVQNFRKHEDRTIHFTPGINAIRAENEQGKSTLFEAIAYAYFGTAGLKEPIDDVVTYGVPVNKLRVEHGFEVAGVKYRITRSPKGAELYANGSDMPLVTGQKEVSKHVERLFNASQALATKLMLARQKDLGAALAGGPTEAGKMIEALADLQLIDELVGLVGEKLPSGDTGAVKGTIEFLRGEMDPGELPDLAPLQDAVLEASDEFVAAGRRWRNAAGELEALPVEEARKTLQDVQSLHSQIEARGRQTLALQAELDKALPDAPADEEIAELRGKVEQQKNVTAALKLRGELERAGIVAGQWDEPLEKLTAEIGKVEAEVGRLAGEVDSARSAGLDAETKLAAVDADYALKRAQLEGRLIKEESCTFCGKDLKDIPEVALVNNPLYAALKDLEAAHEGMQVELQHKVDTLRASLAPLRNEKAQQENYLKDLRAVLAAHARAELLYARAEAYISLDRSVVPAAWTWTGPGSITQDFDGLLKSAEGRRDEVLAAAARREQQRAQLDDLLSLNKRDVLAYGVLDVAGARETLGKEVQQKVCVQELLEASQQAERTLNAAKSELALAEDRRKQALERAAKAKQQLATSEVQLAEIEANNLLIKKLRAARPAITDKLWSLVLGGVSTYLAKIRGEASTITRVDGRFKINTRPVSGLSGSAEDSLGLSIRYALTRTFLPNVDFAMLDEPAAACSDEREVAMLGMIATAGFAQTVLITHSQLADSFADHIISF